MGFGEYVSSVFSRIPEDAYNLFEIKGTLWAVLLWAISYRYAKWKNKTLHMRRMKLEAWNLGVATVLSLAVVFLFLLFVYSPYQHYQLIYSSNRSAQGELQKLQGVKRDLESVIIQRDEARKILGEFQGLVVKSEDELKKLKITLDNKKAIDAEKARRKSMREKITSLLKEGEELKPDLTALIKYGDQWVAKAGGYLSTLPDPSYKTEFLHPPIPPSYAHLMNTLYTNPAWIKVESHLIVLRKFLADLRE